MKVLIISDIHGGYENLLKVLDNEKDFDLMLILGDILSGYSYICSEVADLLNNYNTKIISVRGNCDNSHLELLNFSCDNPYILTSIDNKLVFMTHGHLYDEYHLPDYEMKFDVYIQGHTHVPMMKEEKGVLYLNPGSITNPRGMSEKSYILYQDGTFYLKEVDTNQVIKKCSFR